MVLCYLSPSRHASMTMCDADAAFDGPENALPNDAFLELVYHVVMVYTCIYIRVKRLNFQKF